MISLARIFRHYTGVLRGWKLSYLLYNLLNARRLLQNRELYRRYGLRKSIFGSIGSQDFKERSPHVPWLDQPGAKDKLLKDPQFPKFPVAWQKELLRFVNDGYMILQGFYTEESVARLNADIDRLLAERQLDFNYTGRKIMESYRHSEVVDKEFFRQPDLLNLLSFIMGRKILPFHTINFMEGSEQRPHSDSIHMSTEPQGYLIAAWTALEAIGPDNGPLAFYPGSHRLPYLSCNDYPSGNTRWAIGEESNRRYEDKIEEILAANSFERKEFHAQPGDVLIWHANLIHGGSPILRPGTTRRSMAAHYFCEGVICYHEISQRPALLEAR
jgi:ectoine hydroxylase